MGKLKNILFAAIGILLGAAMASAQSDRHDVRKGNKDFKKEDYRAAQIDYSKALIKDTASFAANYNLGNTLYREDDIEQALKSYEKLMETAALHPAGSDLYYNLGNAAVLAEDWQTAVDAYKMSLLMNPGDMDAKENYIYAKNKLEEQQNDDQNQNQDQNQDNNDGGGGGGGDDDQDQDQNQDQNNDDNGGGDQDQNQDQDQNNDNDQNEDQQSGGSQDQPSISPQQAQQMLQAIQAKENETQEKVNREKAEQQKRRQKDKNW